MELLKGSKSGRAAKDFVERADDALTPTIVLAELARKYLREGEEPMTIRNWLQSILEASQLIEIGIRLAEESAKASIELSKKANEERLRAPGLGDAIILATARMWHAQVLTGDSHFKGLPETLWLGD